MKSFLIAWILVAISGLVVYFFFAWTGFLMLYLAATAVIAGMITATVSLSERIDALSERLDALTPAETAPADPESGKTDETKN